MCGECKGTSFWCNICERDVGIEKHKWDGVYTQCQLCDSDRICKSCQAKGVIYCRWCLVDEKELDKKISELEKLKEQLKVHLEIFNELDKQK